MPYVGSGLRRITIPVFERVEKTENAMGVRQREIRIRVWGRARIRRNRG